MPVLKSRDGLSSVEVIPIAAEAGLSPSISVSLTLDAPGYRGQVETSIDISELERFVETLRELQDAGLGSAVLHGVSAPELTLAVRRERADQEWILESKVSRRGFISDQALIRALRIGFVALGGPSGVADELEVLLQEI